MNSLRLVLASLAAAAAVPAQWQQAAPAVSPSGRVGAGMTHFATSGNLLLFGGSTGFSSSNETWTYNGSNWTLLTPVASPSAKVGQGLVDDVARGVAVMYGGLNTSFFGGPSVDQTWEFDGASWTQVFPAVTPGGIGNHGMAFDQVRNRVVLYGGTDNSFFPIALNGTWEFNGTTWAQVATTGSPGPLERPAMCFHLGIARTVLFGGIDPQTGGVDTTWLYDGTTWSAAPITGSRPAVRTGAKMAFDSQRNVCVLTGGVNPTSGAPIVDTWEFDGSAWTQVASATTGRLDASLAYLPSSRRVVQFGGSDPATFANLADTWEYARDVVIGVGCPGANGVPTLATDAGPRLGQNYVHTLSNLNPTIPIAVLVLSAMQLPATPLAGIGMPGCVGHVSPDVLLTLSVAGGVASSSLLLPTTTSLVGLSIFSQGLSIDPGVNPAGLTASNALDGRIGQ